MILREKRPHNQLVNYLRSAGLVCDRDRKGLHSSGAEPPTRDTSLSPKYNLRQLTESLHRGSGRARAKLTIEQNAKRALWHSDFDALIMGFGLSSGARAFTIACADPCRFRMSADCPGGRL